MHQGQMVAHLLTMVAVDLLDHPEILAHIGQQADHHQVEAL